MDDEVDDVEDLPESGLGGNRKSEPGVSEGPVEEADARKGRDPVCVRAVSEESVLDELSYSSRRTGTRGLVGRTILAKAISWERKECVILWRLRSQACPDHCGEGPKRNLRALALAIRG